MGRSPCCAKAGTSMDLVSRLPYPAPLRSFHAAVPSDGARTSLKKRSHFSRARLVRQTSEAALTVGTTSSVGACRFLGLLGMIVLRRGPLADLVRSASAC